jgi:nucleoside-diphosphate-sugar epimerase
MQNGVVLVTGAGGFIGHHLVKYLVGRGYRVRGVDQKQPEFEPSVAQEFVVGDLRDEASCMRSCNGVQEVYHLAADMGGIGYITSSHAEIAINNALINIHMLIAARHFGVKRFLFSSSACIYPQYLQGDPSVSPLKEEDAFPAAPEEGYGLEKLFMEKLCEYVMTDYGLDTRIVRFHNVYGPLGTYDGGREKAPAAICRKIAACPPGGEIEIWGDGQQTRSFMYIDDCIEGLHRIMRSDYGLPLNLGSDELVTIDGLVDIIADVAGKHIRKRHDTKRPQGVRGRNSDNTRLRAVLNWEPETTLRAGCVPTYRWIAQRVAADNANAAHAAAE